MSLFPGASRPELDILPESRIEMPLRVPRVKRLSRLLRAAAFVPPIVFPDAALLISTPKTFASAAVPVTSVPMKFPWTAMPVVPEPVSNTPLELPEMRLRAPAPFERRRSS